MMKLNIKCILPGLVPVSLLLGSIVIKYKNLVKNNVLLESQIYKLRSNFDVLYPWLCIKQNQKKLETYFINNGYKVVAIYGMGDFGDLLYRELKDTSIMVKCAIDHNVTHNIHENLDIIKPDDRIAQLDVDAIVVTPTFAYDAIQKDLKNKTSVPIVSLGTILDEVRVSKDSC